MKTALVYCRDRSRSALHTAGEDAARSAAACALTIERDALGKPYGRAADGAPVSLSISHAFPFCFAAASAEKDVALGADVERIRMFSRTTSDAFLTVSEKKIVACAPAEKRDELRTLAWSLKESALKALGCGLRQHPQTIDVSGALRAPDTGRGFVTVRGRSAAAAWRRIGREHIATTVVLPDLCAYHA